MKKIAINAVLAIGAFFVILPFIWMLSLSVKPENEIYAPTLTLLPQVWDWANYTEAYVQGEMRLFIRNGLIVTVCILAIQCLTVIPTAYVLARKHFRLQRAMFLLVLSALLIPPQVVAIPLFLVFGELNLLDTFAVLIIPFSTSAFGIFLLRQSFQGIPQDLIDAARMDGASQWYTLWRILVPQIWPSIAVFAILSILTHWNDFFWPLISITDIERTTPPVGVSIFASNESGNDVGPMMASAAMTVAPLMIGFLLLRQRFIKGFMTNGMK